MALSTLTKVAIGAAAVGGVLWYREAQAKKKRKAKKKKAKPTPEPTPEPEPDVAYLSGYMAPGATLGADTRIANVEVRWVDGTTESFGALEGGQTVKLERGSGS